MSQENKTKQKGPKNSSTQEQEEEPYLLYGRSENKNIDFLGSGLKEIIFHKFLNKILKQGLKEPFNFNHMFKIPKYLEYDSILHQINTLMTDDYKKSILNKEKTIYDFYHKLVGSRYKVGLFLTFISDVIVVLLPLLLKSLITWVEEDIENQDSGNKYKGLIIAALLSLVIVVSKLSYFASSYYLTQSQVQAQAFSFVRKKVNKILSLS